jgi:hypothetical protein
MSVANDLNLGKKAIGCFFDKKFGIGNFYLIKNEN